MLYTKYMCMIKKLDKMQWCGMLVYAGQAETRVATTRLSIKEQKEK